MARTLLVATVQQPDQVATNLTTLASNSPGTAGAGNGVLVPNVVGQTFLALVSAGTAAVTVSVNVGATLFSQGASAFSVTIPATAGTYIIGLFHSAMNIPGTNQVGVDFSAVTYVTGVAAVQFSGVY
jgi:hypothetical protein